MKDFYYILGLKPNCTSDQIKEAHRKLSKKFHPDLNQGDRYFENHFREIQEAYEILKDSSSRSQYDQLFNRNNAFSLDEDIKKQQYIKEQL